MVLELKVPAAENFQAPVGTPEAGYTQSKPTRQVFVSSTELDELFAAEVLLALHDTKVSKLMQASNLVNFITCLVLR